MSSETNTDDQSPPMVNALRVPKHFDVELFRSGLQYKAQPDDIFIVTYPRSGTNWMTVIVYTLLTTGQAFNKDMIDYFSRMPFIDRFGKDAAIKIVRPGAIQTHFPFDYVSYNPKAKYISVIRHPKDVCHSMYQTLLHNHAAGFSHIDFNTFIELFITGQTPYIDYFEHLRLTWLHKDDENVLIVSFEQMKQDLRAVIRKIAQFLDIDLTNNEELLNQVEKYSSFDYMKKYYNTYIHNALASFVEHSEKESYSMEFVRKGAIGDWKSYMTDEQSQRFDAIIAEKTRDMIGLEVYWSPSLNLTK